MARINWTYLALGCFLLLLALAFRLPKLSERPMHGDEANQAVRAGILYDTGVYQYDPHEHHGPTLYYFVLPLLWMSGADSFEDSTDFPYRLEIVAFGVGGILLLLLLRDALGLGGILIAGTLLAVSPAMVYYSRYFIQETLLIFFALAAISCAWRYCQRPSYLWAALFGLNLAFIHATKETSVLIFAAMGLGFIGTLALAKFTEGLCLKSLLTPSHLRNLGIAFAIFLLVSITLYTSFFTHWRGALDAVLTYQTYLNRADGVGSAGMHDQPWHYYLSLLLYSHREAGPIWSEGLIILGVLFGFIFWGFSLKYPKSELFVKMGVNAKFFSFIAIYSAVLVILYSLIPYKTPWNLLPFLQAFVLLSSIGFMSVFIVLKQNFLRIAALMLFLISLSHLAWLSYQANFVYPADTRNPYVYAHTSTALSRLIIRIEDLGKVSQEFNKLPIHIVKPDGDYWPLPWYLRQYEHVGYWPNIPEALPEGRLFITDTRNAPNLAARLGEGFISETHALRPNLHLICFIRKDLWASFMQDRR